MSKISATAVHSQPRQGLTYHAMPSNEMTIARLGADCGNRQIKFGWDVCNISVIPSVIYHPIAIDRISSEAKDTHIVRYHAGQSSELSEQTWVVGRSAHSFNGSHTFLGEKADNMHKLALACIPVVGDDLISPVSLRIKELRLCLPDAHDQNKVEILKMKLVGKHHLTIDEQEIKVAIERVKVIPEGLDAYRWLEHEGFYQYLGINGVLDIGGGNTTGQLFSDSDDPIGDSRCVAPGMVALARALAHDPVFFGAESQGCSPALHTILDGIANGSFAYGTTGINFAEVFPKYLDAWVKDIYQVLKTAWKPYLKEIGEVAILGGGAIHGEWFIERTKGRFKIASEPTICTIRGMLV